MPYHVRITPKSNRTHDEVKLDLSDDQLRKRFVEPYYQGRPIVVGGRTIPSDDIERIRITRTEESSRELLPIVRKEQAESDVVVAISDEWFVAERGVDVTDEFITGPPGNGKSPMGQAEVPKVQDSRNVFVVHGRNLKARDSMFDFLRSIGLHPLEWSEAVKATKKATPYVGEILDAAFFIAQAVLVLMTPDDEARLRESLRGEDDPPHETELTPQARPNVLFEAGMAMGRHPDRTILLELGSLRPFSDIGGRHLIRLDNSTQRRQELAQRLESAGCPVSLVGTDWHTKGDFSIDFQETRPTDGKSLSQTRAGSGPETLAMAAFVLISLFGLSWALFWVVNPSQALQGSFWTTLLLIAAIAGLTFMRQWKTEDMAALCKQIYPGILLVVASFLPGALIFGLSLSRYLTLSGLYFATHLSDAPSIALYATLSIVGAGFVLYLPTLSRPRAKQSILLWIPNHPHMIKKVALVCLLVTLAGTSIVPLDTYLVLGTPKVGLVESRYVSDGLIHVVYGADYRTFEAYAINERTLHILLPLVLLVDSVYYPLISNSTKESKIVRSNGLSASLAKDQAGRLLGLWMLVDRTARSTALVTISYYNELNVSSVATINFQKEKALRSFDNGTWQMQQTFEIINISPHMLHIGPIYLYHSTSQYQATKNVTGGFADISYTDQGYWLYFNGDLEPHGKMVVTVTYNRPGSL